MTRRNLAIVTLLFALGSLPILATDSPVAAAPAAGDSWEVSSKMSMEGMPVEVPAQKMKVCSPRVWTEPPGGADERRKCTTSNFAIAGDGKVTWTVTCEDPVMTGEGEITREGTETFKGSIRFTSAEGNMTIKLDGRRLGDCTPR